MASLKELLFFEESAKKEKRYTVEPPYREPPWVQEKVRYREIFFFWSTSGFSFYS